MLDNGNFCQSMTLGETITTSNEIASLYRYRYIDIDIY